MSIGAGIVSSQAFVPNKATGLRLWGDTSDLFFTVSTGGLVFMVGDKSGNGNNLTQATGSLQPTLEPDGSIIFDGVNDMMQTASFTLNQPTTVYILLKQLIYSNFDAFCDGFISATGIVGQNNNAPEIRAFAGASLRPVNSSAINVYDVIATVFDGFNSALQVNNDAPLLGNAGPNDMEGLTLGAQANGVVPSNIQLKEVAIYNTAHDAAQRKEIVDYLIGKSIPFVPSDFTGLEMEMDSLDPGPNTIISGGLMSQWGDKSGSGNHLIQNIGTNQPAVQPDGSILFDGANDFLRAVPFTLNQPTTVYILLKQISFTSFRAFSDGRVNSSAVLGQNIIFPEIRAFAGVTLAPVTPSPLDVYDVFSVVFNGANSVLQVNNNSPLLGNAGTNNLEGFSLGAQATGLVPSNIQVRALLVYSTAHNAAQIKAVVEYLNNRYP